MSVRGAEADKRRCWPALRHDLARLRDRYNREWLLVAWQPGLAKGVSPCMMFLHLRDDEGKIPSASRWQKRERDGRRSSTGEAGV